jgi:hypothetical protein
MSDSLKALSPTVLLLIPASALSNMATVLVPSALLVAGVYTVKPEFVAYAVAAAGVLSGFAFLSGSSSPSLSSPDRVIDPQLTPQPITQSLARS